MPPLPQTAGRPEAAKKKVTRCLKLTTGEVKLHESKHRVAADKIERYANKTGCLYACSAEQQQALSACRRTTAEELHAEMAACVQELNAQRIRKRKCAECTDEIRSRKADPAPDSVSHSGVGKLRKKDKGAKKSSQREEHWKKCVEDRYPTYACPWCRSRGACQLPRRGSRSTSPGYLHLDQKTPSSFASGSVYKDRIKWR